MSRREYLGITIDESRDDLLTDFGKATLSDRYLYDSETYQELFARVATHFSDNLDHAQRLYDYISKLWFMPATPILSNGGTARGLPISCFLNEVPDSLDGIWDTYRENMRLASSGGGIGTCWSNVRSIGEDVGKAGATSGIIPFVKSMDAQTLAVSQGSLRRGSAAVYLDINHPEVEEFLQMRKPSGGDLNRKCLNLHHGICITNDFMEAVREDRMWEFRSPKTDEIRGTIPARQLWSRILEYRMETGEPYIIFIDHVNDVIPEWHKRDGLWVRTSNLCSEITLPTNDERTAVCCLSSVNMEMYDEWAGNVRFIEDIMRFLDNVLSDFIYTVSTNPKFKDIEKAAFSARSERSVGLGVMGFHSYLQQKMLPMESGDAREINREVFTFIKENVDRASRVLAEERGPCPDAAKHGFMERFSNKTSIAPTASISIICGGASPSTEPIAANAYTHKTLSGSFLVKNRYLERLLESKDMNNDRVWSSITTTDGSVQHLDFLTPEEKAVFRTAIEIDQMWVIQHAADRAPLIDQAASNNLFFPPDVDKRRLLEVHWAAYELGVKSLYYCRSKSLKTAHAVSQQVERKRIIEDMILEQEESTEDEDYFVCEACQ